MVAASNASADWSFNMPSDMAALNAETYDLHANILYGCCVIAVIVFAAMIVALIRHLADAPYELSGLPLP